MRKKDRDSEETIHLMIENLIQELECEKYDISIVNHTVEQACNDLNSNYWRKGESIMKKDITYDELLEKIPNKYILTWL